mgnify:CR=1 FL=1
MAPPAYYKSDVTLVVLENTHNLAGGTVLGLAETQEVVDAAREAGFRVHVDGARIWNAATALGVPASALVAGADTAMTCLSKGLGCPVGSLVASSSERIEKARRVRKLLGGGMRQAGVLAAAGLHALEHHRQRLSEDHAAARRLADALRERDCAVPEPDTNIVMFEPADPGAFQRAAADQGLLVGRFDRARLRAVTHLDVAADLEEALARIRGLPLP